MEDDAVDRNLLVLPSRCRDRTLLEGTVIGFDSAMARRCGQTPNRTLGHIWSWAMFEENNFMKAEGSVNWTNALAPIVAAVILVGSTYWAVGKELRHKAAADAYVEYIEALTHVLIYKANISSGHNLKLANRLIAAEVRLMLHGNDEVISAVAAANEEATRTEQGGIGCEPGEDSKMWKLFHKVVAAMSAHVGEVERLKSKTTFAILCEYNV